MFELPSQLLTPPERLTSTEVLAILGVGVCSALAPSAVSSWRRVKAGADARVPFHLGGLCMPLVARSARTLRHRFEAYPEDLPSLERARLLSRLLAQVMQEALASAQAHTHTHTHTHTDAHTDAHGLELYLLGTRDEASELQETLATLSSPLATMPIQCFVPSLEGLTQALSLATECMKSAAAVPVRILLAGGSLATQSELWKTPAGKSNLQEGHVPGDSAVALLLADAHTERPTLAYLRSLSLESSSPAPLPPVLPAFETLLSLLQQGEAAEPPIEWMPSLQKKLPHHPKALLDKARRDHLLLQYQLPGLLRLKAQLQAQLQAQQSLPELQKSLQTVVSDLIGMKPEQTSFALASCLAGPTPAVHHTPLLRLGRSLPAVDALQLLAFSALELCGDHETLTGLEDENTLHRERSDSEAPAASLLVSLEQLPEQQGLLEERDPIPWRAAAFAAVLSAGTADLPHPDSKGIERAPLSLDQKTKCAQHLELTQYADRTLYLRLSEGYETLKLRHPEGNIRLLYARHTQEGIEQAEQTCLQYQRILSDIFSSSDDRLNIQHRLHKELLRSQLELERLPPPSSPLLPWLAVSEQQWWRLEGLEENAYRLHPSGQGLLAQLTSALGLFAGPLRRLDRLKDWLHRGHALETRVAIRVLTQQHVFDSLPALESLLSSANFGLREEALWALSYLLHDHGRLIPDAWSEKERGPWLRALAERVQQEQLEKLKQCGCDWNAYGLLGSESRALAHLRAALRLRPYEVLRWAVRVCEEKEPAHGLAPLIVALCHVQTPRLKQWLLKATQKPELSTGAWLGLALVGKRGWLLEALTLAQARIAQEPTAEPYPVQAGWTYWYLLSGICPDAIEHRELLTPAKLSQRIEASLTEGEVEAQDARETRWRMGTAWHGLRVANSLPTVSGGVQALLLLELAQKTGQEGTYLLTGSLPESQRLRRFYLHRLLPSGLTAEQRLKLLRRIQTESLGHSRSSGQWLKASHGEVVEGSSVVGRGESGMVARGVGPYINSSGVPVLVPTEAKLSGLKSGALTVRTGERPWMLHGSRLKTEGDGVPGLVGALNGQTGGAVIPLLGGVKLLVERQFLQRDGDVVLMNGGNHPGVLRLGQVVGGGGGGVGSGFREELCPYCGKAKHAFPTGGSLMYSSPLLRRALGADELWMPVPVGEERVHAHHLVVGEVMRDDPERAREFEKFGININEGWNGVLLPATLPLACHFHQPLHRGNHRAGQAFGSQEPISMQEALRVELDDISKDLRAGAYCAQPERLKNDLVALAKKVCDKLGDFKWTLTWDGQDYAEGKPGCAGHQSLVIKRRACEEAEGASLPIPTCPHQRKHVTMTRVRPKGPLKPGR